MHIVTFYVRGDQRMPLGLQLSMIAEHGRTDEPIWNEAEPQESWQDAVDFCEAGEAIGICGLDRLPGGMVDCVKAFDELHAEHKSLYDLQRNVLIEPGSAAAVVDMWRIKTGMARMPTSQEAKRRGALADRRGGWEKMTPGERKIALRIYKNAETVTAAASLLGISRSTLNRWIAAGYLPTHRTD